MKHIALFFFIIFFSSSLLAQNISVAKFSLLENDLTANTAGTTVLDQNGEKCALIKVETTQTGFTFDVGSLGVVKNEQHVGEIWVYVPAGVKRMSVAHPQLGVLRDYDLGLSVQKAKTYLMRLTTGIVTTIVTEAKQKTGWIIIDSQPQGASVYLNEDYVGNTPLDTYKAPYGHYTYRLELGNYHNAIGLLDLDKPSVEVNVPLKPAFGSIRVSSSVAGAQVILDGKSTGEVTPCTLDEVSSGTHRLTIQMPKYTPRQLEVEVKDGETAQVSASLDARFARIEINSLQGAQITIDGNPSGLTSLKEDLMEGYHEVEASLEHHRAVSRQIHVEAGKSQTITLEPMPIYGSLDVMSSPRGASVSIDGKPYGQTPMSIEHLLEGNHSVSLILDGYAGETRQVTIREGETASINTALQNGREVTIKSDRDGDLIFVDGVQVGLSPYRGSLSFGHHMTYALRDGKKTGAKQIDVEQGDPNPAINLSFLSTQTYNVKGVTFKMIFVKGGTFQMGATLEQNNADSEENPVHYVTLSDYCIGETEVTQALWEAVMGYNPSNFKGSNFPVECVSWDDCQTFIKKLNILTGANFCLPTEAEWEYAARGGIQSRKTQYAGSSDINEVAWHEGNSGRKTHAVKTRKPNELGIYDMAGNLWEWCQDWFGPYSSSSQKNPTGPQDGNYKVCRGGSWYYARNFCRTSCRGNYFEPGNRPFYVGFRLALSQ